MQSNENSHLSKSGPHPPFLLQIWEEYREFPFVQNFSKPCPLVFLAHMSKTHEEINGGLPLDNLIFCPPPFVQRPLKWTNGEDKWGLTLGDALSAFSASTSAYLHLSNECLIHLCLLPLPPLTSARASHPMSVTQVLDSSASVCFPLLRLPLVCSALQFGLMLGNLLLLLLLLYLDS